MLTQFRHAALAAAALCAAWGGVALAQWPLGPIARLAPGYGGYCEECDLSGRILAGARMSNAVFNGSNFSAAVLTRADASYSAFDDADFAGAELSFAKLIHARCVRAVFAGARLAYADVRGADFEGARFEGADLSGADFRGARGLTQAQLDGACGDGATRLPEGLSVRACA